MTEEKKVTTRRGQPSKKPKNEVVNMLKTVVAGVLIFCFCTGLMYPKKIGNLDEILIPAMMRVDNNAVYVSDQHFIFIYALDDLKLKKKIGGKGEGPGHFLRTPRLIILKDKILAYSVNQVAFFSKSGALIEEKRFSKVFISLGYVKGNYVMSVANVAFGKEKFNLTQYTLFDSNFKEIKAFHSIKFPVLRSRGKKREFLIVRPLTSYQCYDGNIYLLDGQKGFFIKVFDSQGNLLREIRKEYKKIKIPESYKKRKYEEFIKKPAIKKRWDLFKRMNTCVFPEYFPPVQDFRIANGKIYIKTYKFLNQEVEFLILDLNGKFLGKCWLPDIESALFDINENGFCFLKEEETEEIWEFHRVDIQSTPNLSP